MDRMQSAFPEATVEDYGHLIDAMFNDPAKSACPGGRRTANQRGGNLWTARQVVATLSNPVYLGSFKDGDDVRIGHHEPIVGDNVIAAALRAQLRSRRTRTPGRRYEINWPLKGRIRCAACGRPMSPHTIRHGNGVYRYYRCRSTAGGQPSCGRQVSAHAIELVGDHLKT